jgi:tripartite-type tricarboxylate transporter receptor subunit TctC
MMKVKLPRRTFLYLAAGAAALPVLSSIAWAQAYPTRPVRFIHGFAAGGSGDIAARLIAQLLSDRLGQQFIVENRTGAGGNIAVETVARAPADGYTLLQLNVANAINTALYEKPAAQQHENICEGIRTDGKGAELDRNRIDRGKR